MYCGGGVDLLALKIFFFVSWKTPFGRMPRSQDFNVRIHQSNSFRFGTSEFLDASDIF